MASYPTATFAPSAKSNGQTIDASHVNDLQDEVTAVESALRGTITHSLNVSGNSTLTNLQATNSTFSGGVQVTGSVGIVTNLLVGGNSTIGGAFGVTGASTLATVQINGGSTFAAQADFRSLVNLDGSLSMSGQEAVTLASGDNHNLSFGTTTTYVRIATDNAGSTLTGFNTAMNVGRVLVVFNAGPSAVLGLKNSSGSASTSQLLLESDTTVAVGRSASFLYDQTANRFVMIAKT